MGRRRADVEAARGDRVPRGHQGFWSVIRELKEFTIADLDGRSNVHRDTIREFVKRLERAGVVEVVGTDPANTVARTSQAKAGVRASPPKVYRLVKDLGPEAPRVRRDGTVVPAGSARENMWRTMKRLGVFTARDLAVAASTAAHPVDPEDAKSYVRYLRLAGYIKLVREADPHRQAQYRFVKSMDTGPLPPMVQRVRQVFDPNLRKVVWLQSDGGVDAAAA